MRPDFFIVGAPKCGTTSLYHYLRQHPDVFLPYSETDYWRYKEPNHFCQDLIAWPGLCVETPEQYQSLFESAQGQKRVGEASALYLYSKEAAQNIAGYAPDAKIIIMLRHPVDMMRSWHHDCMRWGHETEGDFEKAVLLEDERRQGKSLPSGSGYPSCLIYRDMASFGAQIQRYYDTFGKERVGIWLLEDLATAPADTFREIATFLEVDPAFQPEFEVHNPRKEITQADMVNHGLKRMLRQYVGWARHIKPYVPAGIRARIEKGFNTNTKPVRLNTPDPAFLAALAESMSEDISHLSLLINRDLSHWYTKHLLAAA